MRQTLLAFFLLLFINEGFTQKNEFRFRRITTLQGLSQSWSRCIYQDDIGYMWFGTSDGLNRYDGYEIKVYLPKTGDSTAIGSMVINQISPKSKYELWVCTNNGIYIYNQLTDDEKQMLKKYPIWRYAKDL